MGRFNKRQRQLHKLALVRRERSIQKICTVDDQDDLSVGGNDWEEEALDGNHWEEETFFAESDSATSSRSRDDSSDFDESDTEAIPTNPVANMKWGKGAGQSLRAAYGTGSRVSKFRRQKDQRELAKEATSCYGIASMFKRQEALGLSLRREGETSRAFASSSSERNPAVDNSNFPLSSLETGNRTATSSDERREASIVALADISRLLSLPTEQKAKYGSPIVINSDFRRRHLMVQQFLTIQIRGKAKAGSSRRSLAEKVALVYGRGAHTARQIVRWEKAWVKDRTIPESEAGKNISVFSWIDDEDLVLAIKAWIRTEGDGTGTHFCSLSSRLSHTGC
jgi:hypothetical protein